MSNNIIACVGDNCIDEYLPPINKQFVGGNAVNVAVHTTRAGLASNYIGSLGDDNDGKLILDSLRNEGVGVSHVRILPGKTARSFIKLMPSGDREFVKEDFGINKKRLALSSECLDFISKHYLVHNTLLGGSEEHLEKFDKMSNLFISFDYGERFSKELLDKTLSFVDIAFFSLPEKKWAESEELAKKAYFKGPNLVVVTGGKMGSLAYSGKIYKQSAIYIDKVVDTLGAGDSYVGTFLAGWIKKLNIKKCMQIASKAGAYTCTHYGAWI